MPQKLFLFLNKFYLIDSVVLELKISSIMQIEFISVCHILTNTPRQDNKARSFTENIGGKVGTAWAKDGTTTSGLEGAFLIRTRNILGRIPNVVSSVTTYNISMPVAFQSCRRLLKKVACSRSIT